MYVSRRDKKEVYICNICESEAWVLKKREEQRLEAAQMNF